jgi:hypothetical protein
MDRHPYAASAWRLASRILLLLSAAVVLPLAAAEASRAEGDEGPPRPRLSLIDGDVSFWRPGAEDWAAASINLAVAPGDYLYAGPGARLELQVAARGYLRLGAETEIGVVEQENGLLRLRLTAGELGFDLRSRRGNERFVLEVPNADVEISTAGYYRLVVDGDRTQLIVRQGGGATVTPAGDAPRVVAAGEEVVLDTASGRITVGVAPATDDWDRWNYERTAEVSSPQSARYVAEGVYGVDTLDRYGQWQQTAPYGWVWVPRGVPVGWAPYSAGRWIWDGYYGWTWIDDAPWGWAPYHYGRWVYASSVWAWAPGPVFAAPVYAPALVAFFGGGSVRVGVSVGIPFVSWVALGWGEPIVPWWGRPGFYGVPCWYGWYGPRVVNNVYINNYTKVIKVRDINHYQNTKVRDAVIAVRQDHFGRSAVGRARITHANLDGLRPIAGRPAARAGTQGLVEASGRGRRPPETLRGRRENIRRDDTGVAPRETRPHGNADIAMGRRWNDASPAAAAAERRAGAPMRDESGRSAAVRDTRLERRLDRRSDRTRGQTAEPPPVPGPGSRVNSARRSTASEPAQPGGRGVLDRAGRPAESARREARRDTLPQVQPPSPPGATRSGAELRGTRVAERDTRFNSRPVQRDTSGAQRWRPSGEGSRVGEGVARHRPAADTGRTADTRRQVPEPPPARAPSVFDGGSTARPQRAEPAASIGARPSMPVELRTHRQDTARSGSAQSNFPSVLGRSGGGDAQAQGGDDGSRATGIQGLGRGTNSSAALRHGRSVAPR